ncbi:MAG: hypothetical protein LUM44_09675 [Pyrinomonadaceae bacterium]|nr:hypothetical protein [Pyrinomonadaceae bacterium]
MGTLITLLGGESSDYVLDVTLDFSVTANYEIRTRRLLSEIDAVLSSSAEVDFTIKSRRVFYPLDISVNIGGDIFPSRYREMSLNPRFTLGGDLTPEVKLRLSEPPPILTEISSGAFSSRVYRARLFADNVEIPISAATVESPRGVIGKRVRLQLAKKDISLVTPAKSYKFQLGRAATPSDNLIWTTILETGVLDERSFSITWGNSAPNDELTFGTLAPIADKLNRFPAENIVFYDPLKTEFKASEIETIPIESGGFVGTNAVAINYLTFYKILPQIRKNLGVSSINTNIPNFEIDRLDFPITSSFLESLSGILGAFEPLFFHAGNVLWILDKTAAIPEDFEPTGLPLAKLASVNLRIESQRALDGFLLNYVDSSANANYFTDRVLSAVVEESGSYGASNYVKTETVRTYRDWKNTSDPNLVLRTELLKEVRSTYDNFLFLIGRETETHNFDSSGKRKGTLRQVETLVPYVEDDGAKVLLTVREENQEIFYRTDPNQPKRYYQEKIVTQIRGLIAVDSENTYFDEPFKQDYLDANKAGNLSVNMTTEFGVIKTVTETMLPLGPNRYQVRISTVDHLRNATSNVASEPRNGDATLNNAGSKQKRLLILKEGLTARTGKAIENFAAGIVPLEFAKPLCKRILKRRNDKKHSGSVTAIGFDESIERGTFLTLYNRNGEAFGKFVIEGFTINLENLGTPNQRVNTNLEIYEV